MLRTFHHATGWPEPSAIATSRPARAAPRAFYDALRESLAACRQYQQLRSSGISHDKAIREALGVGPSHSQASYKSSKRLGFAGKA